MTERKGYLGKADLHLHTYFSNGKPSVIELLEHVAKHTDLSVIAVTDHDTLLGAAVAVEIAEERAYPFDVVVGEEVTTRDGHIVGLFLEETVEPGLSAEETIEEIHAQGGLAFAPHPFFTFLKDRSQSKRRRMDGIGFRLADLPVDAVEVDNGTPGLGFANLRARRFNAKRRLPALGNSDAHIACAVGKSHTLFLGRSASDLYQAIVWGATAPATIRYSAPELFAYLLYCYQRHRKRRTRVAFEAAQEGEDETLANLHY